MTQENEPPSESGGESGSLSEIEELRRDLALKTAVLQAGADPLFLLNRDGTIFDVNQAALQIFGYAHGAMIGRNFSERIIAPICQESYRQSFNRLADSDSGPFSNRKVELSAIRSDRIEIPVELLLRPIRVKSQTQFIAYVRDMSESRKTEALLRDSEARFRRLFDSNMTPIFFWDLQGTITEANDCFLKLLGYSRKDFASGNLGFSSFAYPSFQLLNRQAIEELNRTGIFNPFDCDYLHKEGRRVPVLVTGALLEGSRTRGVSIVHDVSNYRNGIRSLTERTEMLAALLNHIPDPAFVKDSDSRFCFINTAVTKLEGKTPEQLLGHLNADVEPEFFEKAILEDKKVLVTGEFGSRDIVRNLQGKTRTFQMRKSALRNSEGRITGILGTFRDITEWRFVENQLKSLREERDIVSQAIAEAILIYDPNGKVAFANHAASRMLELEYKRFTSEGEPFAESNFPENLVREGSTEAEAMVRLKRAGAEERWVLQKARAIRGGDGKLVAVLNIFRDVTEMRKLEELNQQQLAAMGVSLDGLSMSNAEGLFDYVNDAHAMTYGYSSPKDLIGKSWKSLYEPEEARRLEAEAIPMVLSQGAWRGEAVGKKKNGSPFHQELSLQKLGTGIICAIRDISEIKRAQHARKIIDEVTSQLDVSSEYGTNVRCLAQAINNAGLSDWCAIDLIGLTGSLERIVVAQSNPKAPTPFDRVDVHPSINRVARTGRSIFMRLFSEAVELIGAHSLIVVPFVTQNRTLGTITLLRAASRAYDLGDLSIAEEIGRRAALSVENAKLYEKSERAATARNDFVNLVAHDLMNPLSAILLNAAFMVRNIERDPIPTERDLLVKSQLKSMERSAQQMNQLISDFLDLARVESGRLVLDRNEFRIKTIMNDCLETLSPIAAAKNVRLELCIQTLRETAHIDRAKIFQALCHFVTNSIKHTPTGGMITLSVEDHPDELIFKVADNGPGLNAQQKAHLFERNRQSKQFEFSDERGGIGIGLPLAKGFIEAHGGRVWIESALHFSLPYHSSTS